MGHGGKCRFGTPLERPASDIQHGALILEYPRRVQFVTQTHPFRYTTREKRMSTVSKGLAEKIIDKSLENPKFAFLVVPLGIALIYWGISDAQYYRSLGGRPTQIMKDVSIVSKPNDRGFTIPHVVGRSADKEVSIPISAKTARRLEIGDEMEYIETDDNSGKYLLRSSVDGQISSIFFTIAGIPVNFITLLGLVIAIGACAWGAFAKPNTGSAAS